MILKPAPADIQDLYLGSLVAIGFDRSEHDIRFVEDDWENRRRSAPGGSAGRSGWTASRSPSSRTSSRSAASTAGRSPASSPTGSSASRCTCRTSTTSTTCAGPTASRTATSTSRTKSSSRPTTSSSSDVDFLLQAFADHEREAQHLIVARAGAARLRPGAQGGAQLQPARRPRRDQRHRARRATSAASATWRGRWRRATWRAASGSAFRWPMRGSRLRCWMPSGSKPSPTRSARSCFGRSGWMQPWPKNRIVPECAHEEPPGRAAGRGTAAEGAEAAWRSLRAGPGHRPAGAGPGQRAQRRHRLCLAAPAGGAHQRGSRAGRGPAADAQADAGGGRPRRRGGADTGVAEEARGTRCRCVGRAATRPQWRGQGRDAAAAQRGPRRAAGRRAAEGARRGGRRPADSQGHALPAGKRRGRRARLDQRRLRSPGAWPGGAARRRAGDRARARPDRPARDARPPLRSGDGPGGAARCRPLCAPARGAGRGHRQLRCPTRRDRPPAARRGVARGPAGGRRCGAARRGHRAGRAARTCCVRIRRGLPRGAGRMPDPDDEGQPEILPAARRIGGAAEQPFPRRQQHLAHRSRPGDRRQRAGGAAASGRCPFLLRPGPQEDAGLARAGLARVVYHGKLGSQRERVERVRAIAAAMAGRLGGATLAPMSTGRRCSPRPTC